MKEYFIWLMKLVTIVVAFFLVAPLLLIGVVAGAKSAQVSPVSGSNKRVAAIDLDGVIMDSKDFIQNLQRQVNDKSIKGIVVRINSPGGAVGPSQEIYAAIKTLKERKPIVASMGSVAASGGLYAALGASKVYAQPGTMTGSIGVIIQIPNLTKIADQYGFEMITVKSGKLKDVGNTFREMTLEDREFLQSTVDSVHRDFVAAVADGRKLTPTAVRQIADGRVITGSQAVDLKLVDAIGGTIEAARAVFEISGKPLKDSEQVEIVYPDDRFERFRQFFEALIDLLLRMSQGWVGARYEVMYLM